QDDEDKQQASQVEAGHQHAQLAQGTETEFPDGKSHSAKGADGRNFHDNSDDAEQHMGNLVNHVEGHFAALTEHGESKTKQDRKEQHLEDISLGKGIHYSVGNDIHQEVNRAMRLCLCSEGFQRSGVQLGDIGIHAHTRLNHADHHQADRQGHSRDDLKIEQCLDANPAYLLHVLHAGDTGDDGTEDDRSDDHLDQLDEAIAQRFHVRAGFWVEMPEQNTQGDRRQYLEVQMMINVSPFHTYPPKSLI